MKTQNDHRGPSRNTDETAAELFGSMKGFKEGIEKVFGDLDKDRTAERFLQTLRQTKAVTSYTAQFQQHVARVD